MSSMKVFIDTEFTDFGNRDIISLGMVAENGSEFYGENCEYEKKWASQFVKENVLPLCDFQKHGMSRRRLAGKAWEWLDELPCQNITLMIDYGGDNELLDELFSGESHPKINSVQNIFAPMQKEVNARHEMHIEKAGSLPSEGTKLFKACRNAYKIAFYNYFKSSNKIQHHALDDAKANKFGFDAMMKQLGL